MDMARYMACHQRWIVDQEAGLGELAEAAANAAAGRVTDAELRAVVERCMRGYEEYAASRRAMAPEDGAAFFSPPWCTSFENAALWLGGCRPSMAIRLLYSLSGEGLEAHVEELLRGGGNRDDVHGGGGMGIGIGLLGITAGQLLRINDLHRRTLRDEGVLTERLATLQEDIADRPLLPIVRERERARAKALLSGARGGGSGVDVEVDAAMESYGAGKYLLPGDTAGSQGYLEHLPGVDAHRRGPSTRDPCLAQMDAMARSPLWLVAEGASESAASTWSAGALPDP